MPPDKPARSLPAWASALIMLACAAGGAYVIYWYFNTGPSSGETVVLDRGVDDGVKVIAAGWTWRAQSGNNAVRIDKKPGGELQAQFGFVRYDFLSSDQVASLIRARQIVADPSVIEELGLAEQQTKVLRQQVQRGFVIDTPDADRQRLTTLFRQYLDAPAAQRSPKETQLLNALDEIGERLAGPARQATADAARQIQAALTPQQWEKYEKMGS